MNELIHLGRAINEREAIIQACKDKTLECVSQTIAEALLQGQDLLKAKASVQHGEWLPWLAAHCPRVGERQARRYMLLASNRTRVSDLLKAGSLRQALALLEESAHSDETDPKCWPPYLEAIRRVTKLAGYMQRHPLAQWPQEGIERCREELLPLAQAFWPERFQ